MGSQWEAKVKEIVDSTGHRIWGKGEAKNPLSVSPYRVSLLAVFLCPQTGNKAAKFRIYHPNGTERDICLEVQKSQGRSLVGSA